MGVVEDVQAFLVQEGIVDGDTVWPSVRRNLHDDSQRLVVITEDGGPAPQIARDEGLGDAAVKDSGAHILVRAERQNGDAAYAKAREIMDALHGLAGEVLGSTEYIRVVALTSEPVFLQDETERPLFTIAFRLMAPVGA
jgi:hypothetical protein